MVMEAGNAALKGHRIVVDKDKRPSAPSCIPRQRPIIVSAQGFGRSIPKQNHKGELYENTGRQTVCGAAAAQASGSAGQPAAGGTGKAASGHRPRTRRAAGTVGKLLLEMPESFQGRSAPSAAEWAVYLALTLYAMHQQGNDRLMNCPGNTLGRAVRQLAERNSAGQD